MTNDEQAAIIKQLQRAIESVGKGHYLDTLVAVNEAQAGTLRVLHALLKYASAEPASRGSDDA